LFPSVPISIFLDGFFPTLILNNPFAIIDLIKSISALAGNGMSISTSVNLKKYFKNGCSCFFSAVSLSSILGFAALIFKPFPISETFTSYLKKLGVTPQKTFQISLPALGSKDLNLVFLLGFFDGDGIEGTTRLRSGNKQFLEEIKEFYKLNFEVLECCAFEKYCVFNSTPDVIPVKHRNPVLVLVLLGLHVESCLPAHSSLFCVPAIRFLALDRNFVADRSTISHRETLRRLNPWFFETPFLS